MAGQTDSPLYGLFAMAATLTRDMGIAYGIGRILIYLLTLAVMPVVYYGAMRKRVEWIRGATR